MENFPQFYISTTQFRFSSAKISDQLVLVIDHKFLISPLFSVFQYISFPPPISRKSLFPSTFRNSLPNFVKFTCFLHTLCVFRFLHNLTMMHLCITQCTYLTPIITTVLLPFATTYMYYVVANGRSIVIWIFFSNAVTNCVQYCQL